MEISSNHYFFTVSSKIFIPCSSPVAIKGVYSTIQNSIIYRQCIEPFIITSLYRLPQSSVAASFFTMPSIENSLHTRSRAHRDAPPTRSNYRGSSKPTTKAPSFFLVSIVMLFLFLQPLSVSLPRSRRHFTPPI